MPSSIDTLPGGEAEKVTANRDRVEFSLFANSLGKNTGLAGLFLDLFVAG